MPSLDDNYNTLSKKIDTTISAGHGGRSEDARPGTSSRDTCMSNGIMSSSIIGLGEIRTTFIRKSQGLLEVNDDNDAKMRKGFRANLFPANEIFCLGQSVEAGIAGNV